MRCSAAMPWPMQGTVEAVMAQEGRGKVGKYLDFTKEACEEDRNNRAAAGSSSGAPSSSRAPPPPPRWASEAEAEEAFFDAEESPSHPSWDPLRHEDGRTAPEAALVSFEALDRGEAALRCLLQIHASCSETAALMRQVQQSLQRMDENIGAIRAVVAPSPSSRPRRSSAEGADVGAGAIMSRRSSSYSSWMYMLCLGIAGASAVSVILIRAKQRSGPARSS